ncbi:hypothetical protein A2303_05860 [Candidatus Falkowbacteria bacterium RIFOXYB2_FULL_47_14]|uniref:Uncharacterized protein n=1 Tax=Candidatus Falkowbacteria bacterium RIFOXYA2_FULL_47_19 TaxID=1797994 RepID=A0A1F5SHN7_9BACT|nr:MAG: hypothetical protein A2227_02900 [Candidatus Falkowbacteria bacterium RIFOXYA2_FULL_47_19]OGF36105.1 MAG: hypothetical protein A2468_01595 [Candidatus Falkowbacteria bacterium RIFOXYC2_FULL_46_15]OGF44087.1 MAG: hypothetical protein A2303_05860 [Candidatus Falkowbacteria bacterium RIFOXYB2_FULL_47_14]
MPNKKIKKTDLSITIILIIGIIAVVNFFSYQVFHRFDLTQNKVYSISKVSKKAVEELDDTVNIKAYFSDNLPSQVLALKQEVADILDEYAAFSKGRIRVEFISPGTDEDTQRELYMAGIPQLTFQVYEKDQMQLVNGYMGILVGHGDKTEVIPAVKSDTSDLEYQLTTAIKKVTVDEIATIGILSGNETLSLERGGMSTAYQELQSLYTVLPVELDEDGALIPESIDTLIIAGPKKEFSENQLKAINSFLARGGSVLLLIDGVTIGQGLVASKNASNIDTLFAKYGIKLNKDLVADQRSGVASFTQGFMTFSSNYPFWPKVVSEGFNKDNSAVANLESVLLPWASSIETESGKIDPEQVTQLIFSSGKSWRVQDNFNVTPNIGLKPAGEPRSYDLAVSITGTIPNAYPEGSDNENIRARLIVVGDSDFITDNFLQQSPDNLTLFQNLVDSLSLDEDLINIRSKSVSSRPIKEDLSDGTRATLRYLNVFGLTLIVILFGLLRYYMRKRSRFIDEL